MYVQGGLPKHSIANLGTSTNTRKMQETWLCMVGETNGEHAPSSTKKHSNCSMTPRLCCLISKKNQMSERCCAWGWVALTTPSCCDLDRSKRHRCHIGTKVDSHVRQVRIGRRYGREAAKNSIPRLDPSAKLARMWQKGLSVAKYKYRHDGNSSRTVSKRICIKCRLPLAHQSQKLQQEPAIIPPRFCQMNA